MKKRIIAVLLLLAVLWSGCSGRSDNESSSNNESKLKKPQSEAVAEEKAKTVSLACSVTDSFCPYNAVTTLNREMAPLLYDSLIKLDETFSPVRSLARNVEIEGKKVMVTIKNTVFSDGTPLTADDIVYCANKAQKSNTKYSDALEDVESVSAQSGNIVVFILKKADPYFENQLDFPIYKAKSDDKTSSDNIELPPIGSGMYIINEEKTELVVNPKYSGQKPALQSIKLINTPDADALSHNLEVGNITCYYSDLSDCELPQVRGGYESVNLNNLVYLGANMKEGLMMYPEMRQIVSAALDRKSIAQEAYYQNAVAASSIFNPAWNELTEVVPSNENLASQNVYLALLDKIGYNKKDSGGYFINSEGERLKLKMVYYGENKWRSSAAKLIKTDLKIAGIELELQVLDWNEYKTYLKKGYYDLYLAEVKIGNNMDISELVTKGGSAAFGIYYEEKKKEDKKGPSEAEPDGLGTREEEEKIDKYAGETAEKVEQFYKGEAQLLDVASAFATELPIIPICYRTGILSYTTDLSGMSPSIGDVYSGIGNALTKQ